MNLCQEHKLALHDESDQEFQQFNVQCLNVNNGNPDKLTERKIPLNYGEFDLGDGQC